MWFSFWRSRDRFSLDELRYLTDQLQKIQVVSEVNKDFVVEALRSIAELVTYGDQHDPTFFEFFMEKQIMGEFVRILKISKTMTVALQLLQTMSIMIQNLKSEHAIYYIFSNEHINNLITYSFDFRNEELLSYYISFLRAISGKLNKNTISLLVTTKNDEIISFPLYIEAIRFAFHEENMVRIAVRALTLNVYHVGDDNVNKYVSSIPQSRYFSDLVTFFRKLCINLDELVSEAAKDKNPDSNSSSRIISAVDEIEDNLYYFSDVISSGIPDLGRLITESILHLLVFPVLLPSLKEENEGAQIGAITSLYLLCCILGIVKTRDLASNIGSALFCLLEAFVPNSEAKPNGFISDNCLSREHQQCGHDSVAARGREESFGVCVENSSGSQIHLPHEACLQSSDCGSQTSPREVLLSYITSGNDLQVLGSLNLLATMLQTKELDESMLDGLGILPQRKQHKKLLLQALVGEGSGEEQLFASENGLAKCCINTELDRYLQNLKDNQGLSICCGESGINPRIHRYQVLDALVQLFCRPNISAEALWAGGWLLRQLLPHSKEEFSSHHIKLLKGSYEHSTSALYEEIKGSWCDLLATVMTDEWKNCKKAIESPSAQKDPKRILLPYRTSSYEGGSSFADGERMCEKVKVFVLQLQLLIFSSGGTLPEQPPVYSPTNSPVRSRARITGLDVLVPKPGTEINLGDAVPCRIAFERGKERHFSFLVVSKGTSGWVLLAEELPLRQLYGVVRVAAPLAGSSPRIDDKHPKWLHLRIRPSTLPFIDPSKLDTTAKGRAKVLVDGRWTLAFYDEQACKSAESMILEEIHLQRSEVEKRVKPLLDLERSVNPLLDSYCPPTETPSASPTNSL